MSRAHIFSFPTGGRRAGRGKGEATEEGGKQQEDAFYEENRRWCVRNGGQTGDLLAALALRLDSAIP